MLACPQRLWASAAQAEEAIPTWLAQRAGQPSHQLAAGDAAGDGETQAPHGCRTHRRRQLHATTQVGRQSRPPLSDGGGSNWLLSFLRRLLVQAVSRCAAANHEQAGWWRLLLLLLLLQSPRRRAGSAGGSDVHVAVVVGGALHLAIGGKRSQQVVHLLRHLPQAGGGREAHHEALPNGAGGGHAAVLRVLCMLT